MLELRYSPDQPRDDHGRFGEGEGSADNVHLIEEDPEASASRRHAILSWQGGNQQAIRAEAEQEVKTGVMGVTAAGEPSSGHAILQGIGDQTYGERALYRGLAVGENDPLTSWEVGQSVQIMPSSFSSASHIGYSFAVSAAELMKDMGEKDDKFVPVVIHVLPQDSKGKAPHGIDLNTVENASGAGYAYEKEVITGGQFEVTDKSWTNYEGTATKVLNLYVRQKGIF